MKRRAYRQSARADATRARRDRVVDAVLDATPAIPPDGVTLDAVAEAAGVSTRTVIRLFGSKEGLIQAAMVRGAEREMAEREVAPGDVEGAARALARRYEAKAPQSLHLVALEDRYPFVHDWLTSARQHHLRWLGEVFARWLPARGPKRTSRLLALFGATEIYVWASLRLRLGHGRAVAEAVMLESLRALVERWEREDSGGKP